MTNNDIVAIFYSTMPYFVSSDLVEYAIEKHPGFLNNPKAMIEMVSSWDRVPDELEHSWRKGITPIAIDDLKSLVNQNLLAMQHALAELEFSEMHPLTAAIETLHNQEHTSDELFEDVVDAIVKDVTAEIAEARASRMDDTEVVH